MRKHWHQAADNELYARVIWLETQLSCALALLKSRDQTPISLDFIEKTDVVRKAGPDDPAWARRYEAAH